MNEVAIIGGGPSLINFNFRKLKRIDCIAVNQSIFDVPNAKYFVTVDQTFLHKITTRLPELIKHPAKKIFIVNMATGHLIEKSGKIIDQRFNLIYDFSLFQEVIKSWRCDGISTSYNDFRNGANSGFAALQLALLLGYKTIRLLGIDLTINGPSTHYHQAYSGIRDGFLDKFTNCFRLAIPEIKQSYPDVKLISCSPISKLNDLIPFEEFK